MMELEEINKDSNDRIKEIMNYDDEDTKPLFKIKEEEFKLHDDIEKVKL